MKLFKLTFCIMMMVVVSGISTTHGNAAETSIDVKQLAAEVKQIGPKGAGSDRAIAAVAKLNQLPPAQLIALVNEFDDASPLAANWLRGAVETIFDRATKSKTTLPKAELEKIVVDVNRGGKTRRLAYELLTRLEPETPGKILPTMLNDTSMEMRRDAVEWLLKKADKLQESDPQAYLKMYQEAFATARDPDQIDDIAEKLAKQKQTIDLPKHYGFIMDWQLVGPFENTKQKKYNAALEPEKNIDLRAKYEGKEGDIKWKAVQSEDSHGKIDFNKEIGDVKEAISYATADFEVDSETSCEIRYTCNVASKLFLNGKEIFEREIYHTQLSTDQYVVPVKLNQGKNTILVKICQNEKKQPWERDWILQLRVCDKLGTPILSKDRKETPKTAFVTPKTKKDDESSDKPTDDK